MFNKHFIDRTCSHIPDQDVIISLSKPNLIFTTVCTKNRKRWLAQADIHESLLKIWSQSEAWIVGRYVLMPDHLHFFCAPIDLNIALDHWIAHWKRQFTRSNPDRVGGWQSLSWHHRLRREESYQEKWEYVRNNPVRAGLTERPEDWPYQGELNSVRW